MDNMVTPVDSQSMDRVQYDLSHWSMMAHAIGSLMTHSCIPIIAGDSIQIDMTTVYRLSPLVRNMYLDACVDKFIFWIPYRYIYSSNSAGSRWDDFIKAGNDEGVTLGTDTLQSGVYLNFVGLRTGVATTLPRWLTRGYVKIWNRYFRDPSDTSGILAEDVFTTYTQPTASNNAIVEYGLNCCHLDSLHMTSVTSTLTTADYRLPLTDTNTTVDLLQLAALKGHFKQEQARDYFDLNYAGIMKYGWGAFVNADVDQRPELLMHVRQWLSGYDVDGTDSSTLGTYSGKGQAVIPMRMPPKFFPEHGTLWIMSLVRFPWIHVDETHYLVTKPEPTYKQIAADPEVSSVQSPISLNFNDFLVGHSSVTCGDIPFNQWYRTHPSQVHGRFDDINGHPFLEASYTTRNEAIYITNTLYDESFLQMELKHCNSQSFIGVEAKRYVADPQANIFAAANH